METHHEIDISTGPQSPRVCPGDRSETPSHSLSVIPASHSSRLIEPDTQPATLCATSTSVLCIRALPTTSITCAPPFMSLPPTTHSVYLLLRILARLHSTSSSTNIVPLSCLKTRWAKPSSLLTSSTFRRPLVFVSLCYHSSTSYPLTPPWQASKHSLNP